MSRQAQAFFLPGYDECIQVMAFVKCYAIANIIQAVLPAKEAQMWWDNRRRQYKP